MASDARWQAVFDPGKATDFFAAPLGRPGFDARATVWQVGLAWWCSEMSRAIYRRDGREPFFASAGLRELQFFDAGSTQAGLIAGDGFAVLVFRGTADLRDWLTNLRVAPVPWQRGGRVHEGFARGLAYVWRDVEPALRRLDVPAFVAGHSLGGALATVAAAQHEFAAAYTFGAPRVGDAAFWRTLRCPLYRVVNGKDVVPTVPPRRLGYAHGGELHELGTTPLERRRFAPHERLVDHAPANYPAQLTP
jgi:triacylglycerol lipase